MIDKIIHQIVGPQKNDLITLCLQSWYILSESEFEIYEWDDHSIAAFLEEHYPFAFDAFTQARNHGEAADIARYLIVYHFGGCYVDWDVQLLDKTAFLNLLDINPHGYLIIDPVNETLASECFAANKGEQYLFDLTTDIVNLYNNGERNNLTTPFYSGPYRMRDSLQKHKNSKQTLIVVKDVFLYDFWEIRDRAPKKIDRPLIHYWLHSWM